MSRLTEAEKAVFAILRQLEANMFVSFFLKKTKNERYNTRVCVAHVCVCLWVCACVCVCVRMWVAESVCKSVRIAQDELTSFQKII